MSELAPTATSFEESTPADVQDFIPLDVTPESPENPHYSPTGDMVVRAAVRVNEFMERNNKARHDAVDWTKSTAEEAKERVTSVFRRIGHAARRAVKTTFVDVPMAGVGMAVTAGEAVASGVNSGVNAVKSAGEAVSNKATNTADAAKESFRLSVEDGKDTLANTHDKVRAGLGRTALLPLNTLERFREWQYTRAERNLKSISERRRSRIIDGRKASVRIEQRDQRKQDRRTPAIALG